MQIFVNLIKNTVDAWKENGYEGIYPETRNILRHMDQNPFLHRPQREAFETYIYLKEVQNNASIPEVVASLASVDEGLLTALGFSSGEAKLLPKLSKEDFQEQVQAKIEDAGFAEYGYANYVFALTMGTGKTILMATLLMYEFVIAYNHEDDERFAKNALVFGPADTGIVEVLKEIKEFLTNQYEKILPKEYMDILLNITYWYLEKPETPLNPLGNFNVIVSNSSKIILKNWADTKKGNPLFELRRREANKRLEAIQGLESLTVFVDEAHHSYGDDVVKKLNQSRKTINYLAENTKVASVVNMTGTPYVKNQMLPDTVYTFGLKEGIEHGILKQVYITNHGSNGDIQSQDFVNTVVSDFWERYGEERLEGRLPKIAFYTTDIDMLEQLEQNLGKALKKLKIPLSKKISWHSNYTGDKKKDADYQFERLDTPESEKQFILLVNKGTEGWNCKSLVAVAMYKNSTSNNFVLQASSRCLRRIGDNSAQARVFLSDENYKVLDREIKKSFNTDIDSLNNQEQESADIDLVVEKKRTVKVKKKVIEIKSRNKVAPADISIKIRKNPKSEMTPVIEGREVYLNENGQAIYRDPVTFTSEEMKNEVRTFGIYDVIALAQEKTHFSYKDIRTMLEANKITSQKLISAIESNYMTLYDIVDQIISQAYDYEKDEYEIEQELQLTKNYPFKITVTKQHGETDEQAFVRSLVVFRKNEKKSRLGFHINPYNFDSGEDGELEVFRYLRQNLDKDEHVNDVYFTGGVTNDKHNEFYFEYQNNLPEGSRISKYFPDFLVETSKGRYLVIEVKGGDKELTYNSEKEQFEKGSINKDKVTSTPLMKEIGFREFQEMNDNFEYHIIFNSSVVENKRKLLDTIKTLK